MRKTLTAIAAAATLTLATVAAPQHAEARHGRYYYAPGPAYYYGPRCFWTSERYWNGWRWHTRRVRVCD